MVQVILFIITFGIYGAYWFYQTTVEMKNLDSADEVSPGLWTVLLFIPIVNFYVHYKYSELYEDVADDHLNKWILFILWIVFCPAVWFIVQTELNKKADLVTAPA
jgi:cytochrome bd-type quinol oxidase subunit 2